jgi:polysaccharide export outer membrane protein
MLTMRVDKKMSIRSTAFRVSTLAFLTCCATASYGWQMAPPNISGMGTLSPTGNGAASGKPRSGNAGSGPVEVPDDFATLKLAPGFLLDVQVFDEPQLSGMIRVNEQGDIKLPLIDPVHVAGDTLPQAEAALTKSFQDQKVLLHPQVTLNIDQFAGTKITVLGEVQSPGEVDLLTPKSLDVVLSRAGGATNAAGNVIQVKHVDNGVATVRNVPYSRDQNTDSLRSIIIYPGDTVTIPRAGIVYVMGSVGRPGGYVMQEDGQLNVIQALALADGTNYAAAIKSVHLVRKGPDGSYQEIPVDFRKMMDGKLPPLPLKAEDIVYVPVSKAKAIMSAGMGVVSSTSSALIYTH